MSILFSVTAYMSSKTFFCLFSFDFSMGGHGALICALKNPGKYRCVSAFAPICNPINCPWGKKAFTGYLGLGNILEWKKWDATELVKEYDGPPLNILIDQVWKNIVCISYFKEIGCHINLLKLMSIYFSNIILSYYYYLDFSSAR